MSPPPVSGSYFSCVFENQIKFVLICSSAHPEQGGGPAVRSAPVSQRNAISARPVAEGGGGGGALIATLSRCARASEALIRAEAPGAGANTSAVT